MAVRSESPTEIRAATDASSSLARSALEFAVRCHAGQVRESDGSAFIEHPLAVARLLRDAGCSDDLVIAGLLHEVIEEAQVSVAELAARFGADVADLVHAVTDHASVQSYRQRKQVLREQVRDAGRDAALLFAADKISRVRDLPLEVSYERKRFASTAYGSRVRSRLERVHQMRLEHYHESLGMLQRVVPRHLLIRRLATELGSCSAAIQAEALSASG